MLKIFLIKMNKLVLKFIKFQNNMMKCKLNFKFKKKMNLNLKLKIFKKISNWLNRIKIIQENNYNQ